MKPLQVIQRDLNKYIARLSLGPGDSLIIDGSAFDVPEFVRNLRVPKGAGGGLIFAVFPSVGQSLLDCFLVMKESQLRQLTRDKLMSLLNSTNPPDPPCDANAPVPPTPPTPEATDAAS